jgi:aspartate/methionine/tyrosine aminotransferase
MSTDRFIASRMASIGASGIRRIFDLAATMTDPVDFSIGQPDFDVPGNVKQAAIRAIEEGRNGYTVTHGLPRLRERIGEQLQQEFGWDAPVLVTCGVSGGLALALLACVDPGDEVLIGDPYFVSYKTLVVLAGGTPVPVSQYDDLALHPERFAEAVTPRTKAIIVNSPGNPTGVVYPADAVQALCTLAHERSLLILSDEIYNVLCYEGSATSPVRFAPERTVLLRGFGKTYGMTGWRMGYAAGPAAILQEMAKLQQYTFVCAPQPAQWACISALDTPVSHFVDAYRRKRDLTVDALKDHFAFVRPGGGFYVFCKAPARYESATAFVEAAIARNVLTIPGCAFSERDTHFRISYAVDDEKLGRGCEILNSLAG